MSTQNIPIEASGLGAPLAFYRVSEKRVRQNLAFLFMLGGSFLAFGVFAFFKIPNLRSIAFAVGGLLVSLGGLYNSIQALRGGEKPRFASSDMSTAAKRAAIYGPYLTLGGLFLIPGILSGGIVSALLGILLIGIAAYGTVSLPKTRQDGIIIFADGFSYTLRGKTTTIHWNDVEGIWMFPTQYSVTLTIREKNGKNTAIDDQRLENYGELLATIQETITQRLLPDMTKRYEKGHEIPFGSVIISKNGLSNGRETLSWDKMETVDFDDKGQMQIEYDGKKKQWAGISIADIPNLYVLTALMEQIQKSRQV